MGVEREAINYLELLYEWQTLVAGLIALIGALITTAVLIQQHSYDKKKHKEEKEKTEFYMRSLIPDALSDLISYSEKCFQYVLDEKILPEKPNAAIEILKQNIKYSDVRTPENLFKIVSFYQVHNSRIDSYKQNLASNKKENIFYDICLLNHYFNSLFSYARNEKASVKTIFPDEKEMIYSVKSLIGRDRYYNNPAEYEDVFSRLETHRKAEEKYSRPKIIRQACNFIYKLQNYYKYNFKS